VSEQRSPAAPDDGAGPGPEGVEASLLLAAPPERVAAVVADLAAYPQWNPEIPRVEVVEVADGLPRLVRLTLAAPMLRDELLLEYAWRWPQHVRWRLVSPGRTVTRLDGSYTLAPAPGGAGTTVTYRLTVELGVALIAPLRRKAARTVIDRALAGLQQRVEAVP
jgi:Polyketide cyclase / dehydrase and lipid transport